MRAVGVDSTEGGGRIVVVDGDGRVLLSGAPDPIPRSIGSIAAIGIAVDRDDSQEGGPGAVSVGFEGALDTGMPEPHLCAPGAAAIAAEVWLGAARGARDAVCLVIGEHVTAGILLGGTPWTGAHGMAGAAAWLALNPVERQDYRKYGSLAAEVSSAGVARRLSWRIQAGDDSAVLERAGDLESITAQHVFDAARAGDGVAISVVRDTARYIAMAIANLASTLDPEVVVLAGTMAAASDLLLDPVRQECARRLPARMADLMRIDISPLGQDGIAIGAARLAMLAQP